MNKTKCLFISHVPVNTTYGGGAGISLKTFLEHQDFLEIDLIIPLFVGYLLKWPHFIRRALAFKPTLLRKIYFLPLPFNNCQEGAPLSRKAKTAYFVNNIISWFFLPITKKIMRKKEYRFVHLNSIVLNPLISSNNPKQVLHVREVLDVNTSQLPKAINNLLGANGLICIDPRTYSALKNCSSGKSLPCNRIINNPFDMTKARGLRKERQTICKELNLGDASSKLFVYLGMLHPIKGTDLIIKAFIEAGLDKAKLLIVGTGNPLYLKHYRTLARRGGNNIIFIDRIEFQEVMKIYAVSDFIVRGDPDFRIGRTTYEALYAGSNIIIPGIQDDLNLESNLQPFASRMFFYQPQDIDSLAETMQSAYNAEVALLPENAPTGNTNQHCDEIKEFLNSCLFPSNEKICY